MLKSIRWSLQLWHAGLLAVVLAGFGISSYIGITRAHYQEVDAELERTVQLLAGGLHFPPPSGPWGPPPPEEWGAGATPRHEPHGPWGMQEDWGAGTTPRHEPHGPWGMQPEIGEVEISASLARRFGDGPAGTFYYVIWNSARSVLKTSRPGIEVPYPESALPAGNVARPTSTQDATPKTAKGAAAETPSLGPHPHLPWLESPKIRQRDEFREAFAHGPFGMRLLVGRSVRPDQAALRRLALLLSVIGAVVLVIGLAGGWILSRRAVHPILAITMAAQEISASNLSRRIDPSGTQSELGTLAVVLNDAFARLEAAFQRQVRFTADASHELRTPLAVIHTNVQLALSRERSAEEYRKTLDTCLRASNRMKSLVDSLLMLARADVGRLVLQRSTSDLRNVVAECVAMVAPLAEEKRVTVESDLQSVRMSADSSRIAQVVTNLLTNAIRYNYEGGRVQVSAATICQYAVLVITDTGVGIPPEGLPHVFERFYRANAARSRDDGGSGLGLAICKTIVEAHGGTIVAHSAVGGGATFTVRLPLAEPEGHSPPADCPAGR
jgi:heavy metal sensor kinase